MSEFYPGCQVLVRGTLSADGRFVTVAPGAEMASQSVEIVTDLPVFDGDAQPFGLMLFFATEHEREQFAEDFSSTPNAESRYV